MKYLVHKGRSYTDVKGRGKVYGPGEIFEGLIDPNQAWKVGFIEPTSALPIVTKGVEVATQTEETETETEAVDPMDEGEETE